MEGDAQPAINLLDNPIRDAAIHFGAFLQKQGLLHGGDKNKGSIEISCLLDQFSNYYQPLYRSYLLLPELLPTLRKYHVIMKPCRKDKENKAVRVIKHPHPENVKEPKSIPRPRIYVDQNRVLRERLVHPEVINQDMCRLCNETFINKQQKELHLDSDIHKYRLLYREKRSSYKDTVNGASISIEGRSTDEKEVILRIGEQSNITVKVIVDSPYISADVFKIFDIQRLTLGEVDANPTSFHNGVPIEINVTASFPEPGAYLFPLVVKIMPTKLCLLKDLIFRVESELIDQLAPSSPYVRQQESVIKTMEGALIPGETLAKSEVNKLEIHVHLGEYKAPPLYNKLLAHKLEKYDNITEREEIALTKVLGLLCGFESYREALKKVSQTKAPFIQPLDQDNYSDRFSLLLHLEELQQQRQIRNYDQYDKTLQKLNSTFFLQVPDLSEGRPSVNKGDKVHVKLQNTDEVIYEGIIHEIKEQGLVLGFHRAFYNDYKKLEDAGTKPKVDVRFTVNRFPYQNMHRALSLIKKHEAHSLAFPEKLKNNVKPTPKKMRWVNQLIESNPQQQTAVKKIVSKSSGSAPFLIFGPPGTGKTVTLVEAIAQVWLSTEPHVAKQLVCAPSNAACNNIAVQLIKALPKAKILRFFSLSTEEVSIPNALKKHSNFKKDKGITLPTLGEIMTHDIIITTLVTSGRLVTGGAGGKFHFVYIDECGQASEPEALIAIAGILTTKSYVNLGQLVLAGDPQQLGPIFSSQLAKDFGLGMSLLERLMNHNDLYKKNSGSGYDSNYLTKLIQNFRSHPSILNIPNKLFYEEELQTKGKTKIINKAVGWNQLPNPDFPLIFHGVQGLDERESNSPSYFNRQEIDRVHMYIEILLKNGLPNNYKVQLDDIGVITPYRKQVQKFRKLFEMKGWKDKISVGSVEEFQGSEKLIIFISTVRSSIALVEEDYRFRLGFLKNPKRFNVSVTRAQALLIVVGNPNILRHDKQWYELLTFCKQNNAYRGIPFPEGDPPEYQPEHISS